LNTVVLHLLALHAEAVDKGLRLIEVLLGATGVGSVIGITAAMLERKPPEEVPVWGYWGTTIGCLSGFLLMLCIGVLLGRS
jgi:hypothetical protein